MKLLLLFSLLGFMAACSTRKMTREEWLKVSQKRFKSIEKEQLIKSAEKLLALADKEDITFTHYQDGFKASRFWRVYAILAVSMGTDSWQFEVKEENNELVASLYISNLSGTSGGVPMPVGSPANVTVPVVGNSVQGPALYEMFWSRLDYLTGRTTTWMDCGLAKSKIDKEETWGNIQPLCDSFTVEDELPNDLSDIEIDRIFFKNYDGKNKYLQKNRPGFLSKQK